MESRRTTQAHYSNIYDNFLTHWKYVKREKVNGAWKYTYEKSNTSKNDARKSVVDKINNLPGADKVNELIKPLDEYLRLYQEAGDSKIKADGKIPDAVRNLVNEGRAFVDRIGKK